MVSVIVLSDDELTLAACASILDKLKFMSYCGSSYEKAKTFLSEFHPDLVIVETQLEIVEFINLLKSLHIQEKPTKKIVLTTSKFSESELEKIYELGATRCIDTSSLKPADLEYIISNELTNTPN